LLEGRIQVNGKEQTVKKTEATFLVTVFCRGNNYALCKQILLKDEILEPYAELHPTSNSQQGKLKYFARPTVGLS